MQIATRTNCPLSGPVHWTLDEAGWVSEHSSTWYEVYVAAGQGCKCQLTMRRECVRVEVPPYACAELPA